METEIFTQAPKVPCASSMPQRISKSPASAQVPSTSFAKSVALPLQALSTSGSKSSVSPPQIPSTSILKSPTVSTKVIPSTSTQENGETHSIKVIVLIRSFPQSKNSQKNL